MMRSVFWRGAVLTALVATSLAACSAVQPGRNDEARSELNRQRRLWRAQAIDDYAYTLQRLCFCPPEITDPVRVQVGDGVVESRTYVDGGGAVNPEYARLWPTVEGLFDVVQDAIDRDAHSITVQYHPQLGHPTSIQIDYDQMTADEELGLTASDLQKR